MRMQLKCFSFFKEFKCKMFDKKSLLVIFLDSLVERVRRSQCGASDAMPGSFLKM